MFPILYIRIRLMAINDPVSMSYLFTYIIFSQYLECASIKLLAI